MRVSDLNQLRGEEELVVALVIAGESSLFDFFLIRTQRLKEHPLLGARGLAEFRDDCLEESKEIVEHELEDRGIFQGPCHHVECRGD